MHQVGTSPYLYLTPLTATRLIRTSLTWKMRTDENYHEFDLILSYSHNQRLPQVMSIHKHHCAACAYFKHHLINILHISINKNLHQRNIYQPTDVYNI